MDDESFELQQYLDVSRSVGIQDSEGSFVLAGKQALQSLAKYTFPFRGAWVLKLIQSIVAGGVTSEIRVRVGRGQTTISVDEVVGWSLAELGSALVDPTFQGQTSLLHAVVSLRTIGFGEKVPFLVCQGEEKRALAWDGQKLNLGEAPKGLSKTAFVVSTTEGVKACLQERAFTCPVPLKLNRNRLDAIERDPYHGWASRSQLIAVGFIDNGAPAIKIPQNSGHEPKISYDVHQELAAITKPFRAVPQTQTSCSLAFLLAAHLRSREVKGYKQRRKVELHRKKGRLNWVRDGIVVQSEELPSSPEPCSLGIFLSSEGLGTDAGTLQLLETPEKVERVTNALAAVKAKLVKHPIKLDWEKRQSEANRKGRIAGVAFGFMGLLMISAEPVLGTMLIGGGVAAFFFGGRELHTELAAIERSMARLSEE